MTPDTIAGITRGLRGSLIVAAALVFLGCASVAPPPPVPLKPRPSPAAAGSGWWYARFRMSWPEGAEPAWHLDLLIADLVVKPVLARHAPDITLWRFHRRAARDGAGHQFSFIFYASPAAARNVYAELAVEPVLQLATAAGRLSATVYDDPDQLLRPEVSDTSDRAWSEPVRQAWPHYLMGASQMWLDLISILARGEHGPPPAGADFTELEGRYAELGASITALWQNEGRHAFLHHLNALFGYEPILIIEKRQMRF